MSRWIGGALLVVALVWLPGCTGKRGEHFTLEVDMPAEFKVKTAANYHPAPGETCTLPQRRGRRPERKVFFTEYKPVASRVSYELPLTETVDGCPLAVSSVVFDFYAKWGKRDTDVGGDIAGISIRDRREVDVPMKLDADVLELSRQCQWHFRTVGPHHAIRKILLCNALDAVGRPQKKSAAAVAQRDQLSGKTLRLVLTVTDEELPAFDDRWISVPGGWRRCKGKSVEDLSAYCSGNTTDFKPIKMPDGRICDVYPTCM